MNLFEPKELKQLRRSATPSREFRGALRTQLLNAYDAEYGKPKAIFAFSRFAAVGVASLALVFGMGTGVYAYESPEVVDGHPLYPVKNGIEQVEGMLAFSPEAKARFHTKMMNRRINEAVHFMGKPAIALPLLEQAAAELGMSVDELKSELKDPASRAQVIEQLGEENARYLQIIQRVQTSVREGRLTLPPKLRERLRGVQEEVRGSGLSADERRQLFQDEWSEYLEEFLNEEPAF